MKPTQVSPPTQPHLDSHNLLQVFYSSLPPLSLYSNLLSTSQTFFLVCFGFVFLLFALFLLRLKQQQQ